MKVRIAIEAVITPKTTALAEARAIGTAAPVRLVPKPTPKPAVLASKIVTATCRDFIVCACRSIVCACRSLTALSSALLAVRARQLIGRCGPPPWYIHL